MIGDWCPLPAAAAPLRCLFVTNHWYSPQMVGGAESSTHELCKGLIAAGHKVAVLAALRPRSALAVQHRLRKLVSGRDAVRDDIMGYPVFRCRRSPREAVDDVLERFNPDIAVVQVGALALMADTLVTRGVPTIVYLRDVEFKWYDGALRQHTLLRYIANSEFNAARHRAAFNIEADVIPPLVQPERYRCTGKRTHVTFVNPVLEKGVEVVLKLVQARPDIPFLVVEGWPLPRSWRKGRTDYQPLLRGHRNVTWQRSVADMRKVYSRTRILLAPSMWEEAWCRVVTEAQISGIPVLTSDRGGLPASVGPGGILVSHTAPIGEWTRQLSAMWDDTASYAALSRAAAAHARRPEIQPSTLLSRFIGVLQSHALLGSLATAARQSWHIQRRAVGWSLTWMVALLA
jgi:glycosyltransferase involved in cell wall biosynthesis